ncbi:MAG: tRNA (adenosine(37)-N6)-dimethylallyltransferase MiaA [Thermoleophilia bacterium]|nr:tRNA (adenosine(37)-N6)-dimethylallyltransferase MiaA [Thermoleophilia bacterium]
MAEPFVLALFGPTASGKSAVAEALAERAAAELVSADAMQLYRGLPILTNQASYPTHLVAIWPLSREGSLGEYERRAHATVDEILARGRTPVVVGGTGLYLRAALAELAIPPEPAPGLRERLEAAYERLGPPGAHALLSERDPAAAAAVHPNDRRRVVRALELAELGSSLRPADDQLWTGETRHPTLVFGLDVPIELLDRRIEERARAMFAAGVEDEVRRALSEPISRTAWTVHGLRPIAELPPEQAFAELVRITRRYARYQRKWMRRIPRLVTVRADRPEGEIADEILEVARARQLVPGRRAG